MVTDVTKDMNTCEEFLEIFVTSHVIAAALQVLKAQDLASAFKTLPHDQLNTSLDALLETVVSRFINLAFHLTESTSQADHVFEYAKETLSLGMLMLEFKDAIKEGDGKRVLRCWK